MSAAKKAKKEPAPKPRDACLLTLTGPHFNIRAEWKKKDAEIFVKAFTAQAMRQT